MSFGEQLKCRRKELGLSRSELAKQLRVSQSAVGNYETGISAPKEEILLRIFDALQVEPNYLYRGSFRSSGGDSPEERALLTRYRALSPAGQQTVQTLLDALCRMQGELVRPAPQPRVIPLYRSPDAAGEPAPRPGADYEPLTVTGDVPSGAELAVRMRGSSMEPYIRDGSIVYVNHEPLANGDVGLFCVDGTMLLRQYCRNAGGTVRLLPLNRADAVITVSPGSGHGPTCFGRALLPTLPLPEATM